jgi:hypothetical protein
MEHNTLTKEQIARINGLYIGQPVVFRNQARNQDARRLNAVFLPFPGEKVLNLLDEIQVCPEVVLLLMPVEKITQEHAEALVHIMCGALYIDIRDVKFNVVSETPPVWMQIVFKCRFHDQTKDMGRKLIISKNGDISQYIFDLDTGSMVLCSNLNDILIWQQLIHWGYAVPLQIEPGHPANGKTAIELGIAIDKTLYRQ